MSIIDKLKEKLSKYPSIKYTIEDDILTIHPRSDSGFQIKVYADSKEYTVCFGDWHDHFENEDEAIDFVGLGLSKKCRLVEMRRGDNPYKWIVQYHDGNDWKSAAVTGIPLIKFWAKKKEIIYQNDFLD